MNIVQIGTKDNIVDTNNFQYSNDMLSSRLKISSGLELSVIHIIEDLKAIMQEKIYTICKMVNIKNRKTMNMLVNEITYDIWNNPQILNSLAHIKGMDRWTYKHCLNVALVSIKIGVALDLSKMDLKNLVIGALLHDIGKIFIPSEILQKSSKLTEEEYEIIKTHSMSGYDYLKEFDDISLEIKNIVSQHHERLDGMGYPRRLYKDEIDYLAKIVTVADVYDAMIAERPYKKAMCQEDVIEYLIMNKNILFDCKIVDILCDIITGDR